MSNLNVKDVILQDFWVHLAGLIAISLGAADLAYVHTLSHDSDLLFILGGFGAMGLKIVNGSAAALRQAALDTAFTAARAAQSSAAVAAAMAPPPPVETSSPK